MTTTAVHALDHAHWIQAHEPQPFPWGERPGYEFRTTFDLTSAPADAVLTATAHGIYEAYLNDRRVGDQELTPGATSYHKTLFVQRYEVADLLRLGVNEIRFVVTDGWFRGRCGPSRVGDNYGRHTALIAALVSDDQERVVVTDDTWEVRIGEIVAADLMDGQMVDLRRRDTAEWARAMLSRDELTVDRARLGISPAPPVRRVREYSPVRIARLPGGRQIIDFGQNLNGWVRLHRLGPAGNTVTLTHGEALDADGDLTLDHLAFVSYPDPTPLPTGQIDRVISRGVDSDVFEPRHTTHGFRYVAVDGLEADLAADEIAAILVRSDLDRTGSFSSSDERVNRLHEIAVASWDANTCDIPTDCPQRERWGYTGDFQIFARAAAFLDDIEGFARKWLGSLADDQRDDGCVTNVAPNSGVVINPAIPFSFDGSAGWGDAATIVPWQVYLTSGNPAVLAEALPMMSRWVDYAAGVAAQARHSTRAESRPDPAPHERYLWDSGFHWGEWLEPDTVFDPFADPGIIATAYLFRSAAITSQAAGVLGDRETEDTYAALAANVRDAWQAEFVEQTGRLAVESQANYVRALAFDLMPEHLRDIAVARLVELIRERDTHLSTGFLSTALLLPVLAQHGETDLAYELLLRDGAPGWMTMLDRDATTVWESWNGVDEHGMPHGSLNHYSIGGVITFLHEHVAGIQVVDPGYRTFVVAPHPGGELSSARAELVTHHGRIVSAWEIVAGVFTLSVTVPPGTTATVVLPSGAQHAVLAGEHEFRE